MSYSTCSLPRRAWTTGALRVSASSTRSSWAPAAPAPARIVTFSAALSSPAASPSASSSGRTTVPEGRTTAGSRPRAVLARKISPGTTTTATPLRSTAARIAICRIRGPDSGLVTVSAYTLQPAKSSCGRVSWKYPEPISAPGIWAAMARTGTRLRWASKSPLIRCRLPGPQLPTHTFSSPVSPASAAAARAALSSCRTCTQSTPSSRRMASVRPLSESPGRPYRRRTPEALSEAMTCSAKVGIRVPFLGHWRIRCDRPDAGGTRPCLGSRRRWRGLDQSPEPAVRTHQSDDCRTCPEPLGHLGRTTAGPGRRPEQIRVTRPPVTTRGHLVTVGHVITLCPRALLQWRHRRRERR
ncbi:exported hypothetical protein [Actinacidiphila cocklensis]|uniref:Uncharacterized protein n=1 Tax=Actinacidiphila cocklensis TaxID=887465 RepID=A0A9W4DI67_9ACTN|nr:exported hypothetical protein [Actinacidiphila cocklensis]